MNLLKKPVQTTNSERVPRNMKSLKTVLLLIGLAMIVALVACSSSNKNNNKTITITLTTSPSPAPTSLAPGGTLQVTATVANDSANGGVTWSCTPANSCGSFSANSSASGTAVTYTAPTTPPASAVIITATSVTDTSVTQSLPGITITAAISISLSTFPTSLYVNDTAPITATVSNDSSNSGVTWSCTPATPVGACGTFSSNSSASGTAVTYTAPANVPSSTVVITATSVANTSISQSTPAITINPASGITVALSGVPTSLVTGGTASITATVANDPANGGVTWSCTPSGSCGSFSANSSASGTAVTYTAPSSPGSVTITATSVTDDAQSASAGVTVTSSIATTLPDGNYVFSLQGTDNTTEQTPGPYFYVGAFTVVGGVITPSSGQTNAGEQDFADLYYWVHAEPITGGTITASADGNLLITLDFTDSYIANGNGQVTLDASLVSTSKALLTEYDNWATGTGELDLQSTTLAAPSGGYAFYEGGYGGGTAPPAAIGGVINVDGSGTISGSGSAFDINYSGTLYPDQLLTASTVSSPDAFGNVTFDLNSGCSICSGGAIASIVMDGYMIDANHIRVIENYYADAISLVGAGTALAQTGTGSFSSSSIAGTSYVFGTTGGDANGVLTAAGVITFNADGSVGGNLSYNDGTAMNAQGGEAIIGGNYTVDPTGRVTVTGATDTAGDFDFNFQFYLNGATTGSATVITMDTTDSLAGISKEQTSSTLNAASLTGGYALDVAQVTAVSLQSGVGAFNSDGVSNLAGFLDFNTYSNAGTLTQTPDTNFHGTYTTTSTNGVFTVNGGSGSQFTSYLIDGTQGVVIENDANQLTLGQFAQQQ